MGGIPGGPMELSVPSAIVKLLCFGLSPGKVMQHLPGKITTHGGFLDDVDISTFEGPVDEVKALWRAAEYLSSFRGVPLMQEHLAPHIYWERHFKTSPFQDIAAKLALFLAMNASQHGERLIWDLAKFDIEDLADAIEITKDDPSISLHDLQEAMFEVAPHKRMN